jgi:tetratricopeptide (TPR) repeat protein
MPALSPFARAACALAMASSLSGLSPAVSAQTEVAAVAEVNNSGLDAQLFYQLLIGEIEVRSDEPGTAYQVLLDAARKTREPQLFRRATDVALQARAGDQALASARAWRLALPDSAEAHRYEIQLLVALNRSSETVEPMKSLLNVTPAAERPAQIAGLPRFFGRAQDRKAAAGLIEQALQPYANAAETQEAVSVALGRSWLLAGEPARALELAQRAHTQNPNAEGPAQLALELLPGTVDAEAIVIDHLRARPASNGIRTLYSRVLSGSQRFADAVVQLDAVTRSDPRLAPPWLMLGALHLELRKPQEATAALLQFVALTQDSEPAANSAEPPAQDDGDEQVGPDRGLTQAWLMLAQAAEQMKNFPAAEAWLAKISNPQQVLAVQSRRASLLARQGKVSEARELIRKTPELGENDGRAKLLAEAQLLRDLKQWGEARTVLTGANRKFPDDADLLYEESMLAEKLNRMDEMERLLRRVMVLKPDHHHAHNALGFSLAERNVRLPEAKALIQKALELAPGEPFITDSLGWVEYRLGNRDEALRLLRGAYQSRPDVEIAAHLGEVLWVSGQRDEARRVLRDARNRDAVNDVLRETLARLKVDL